MDKTIRAGAVKPLIEVTREEFTRAMNVSAYSLIPLTRALVNRGVLSQRASIVAVSYRGAERVMRHPYKNVGVAKAALERIIRELADELGRSHQMRVNGVRFFDDHAALDGQNRTEDEPTINFRTQLRQ